MTAPVVSSLRIPGVPTWDIDAGALRVVDGNCSDEFGRRWTVAKHPDGETGWAPSAAPRTQRTDRPSGHGSYRSAAWRSGRTVTLSGNVECGTAALREQTEVELAGLCADPGRLFTYRRTTDTFDQLIEVELDDAPQIAAVTLTSLAWQFTFHAPDPRKHATIWQQPICHPPAPTAGGLAFPLNFAAGGLDFGTPETDSTVVQVGNYGTAPAHPLMRLVGPLSAPAIVHRETGRALRYTADLADGERLSINCDDFAQDEVPAHAVISSVRGNVGTLLVREGRDWPVVDPQAAASFTLRAYGDVSASLRVGLRSAWW